MVFLNYCTLNLHSVVTNAQILEFGITDSELTTYCLKNPETLNYLFLDSKIVEKSWKV